MTEIVLIQVLFFTVASKQKIKNENTEYHGTFLPRKSQFYSKPTSPFFSGKKKLFKKKTLLVLYYIFMFG